MKPSNTTKINPTRVAAAVIVASCAFFCFSRLSLAPVPWPDGSAFYLPALEIFHWPPAWRMHAQAAFVPSYDQANFNLMPGLPVVLGALTRPLISAGVSAVFAIRLISMVALGAWAWVLWSWLNTRTQPRDRVIKLLGPTFLGPALIGIAALWDPVLRWGTFVVRTETWVGLCWVLILRELWEDPSEDDFTSRTLWWVSGYLALAAYFHFEAFILVPAVVMCLRAPSLGGWCRNLVQVGLRTALFLSPWVVYVLLNFSLFIEQMKIQFGRLTVKNGWIANPYLLFHSLFLELGSPTGVPKFFNLARALIWVLILGLSTLFIRDCAELLKEGKAKNRHFNLQIGAAIAFGMSFYLWCVKAEVWFITLCHLTLWPWLGATYLAHSFRTGRVVTGIVATIAVVSVAATCVQAQRIQPNYSWDHYQEWTSCIDQKIQDSARRRGLLAKPTVWQPYVPDILVELSQRHPEYDLTRALDFQPSEERAWIFGRTVDAIVLTSFFDTPDSTRYIGPLRDVDRAVYPSIPFAGPRMLREIDQRMSDSPLWRTEICQVGAYWAAVETH